MTNLPAPTNPGVNPLMTAPVNEGASARVSAPQADTFPREAPSALHPETLERVTHYLKTLALLERAEATGELLQTLWALRAIDPVDLRECIAALSGASNQPPLFVGEGR